MRTGWEQVPAKKHGRRTVPDNTGKELLVLLCLTVKIRGKKAGGQAYVPQLDGLLFMLLGF